MPILIKVSTFRPENVEALIEDNVFIYFNGSAVLIVWIEQLELWNWTMSIAFSYSEKHCRFNNKFSLTKWWLFYVHFGIILRVQC